MAYESMTYENLLARMISVVHNKYPNLDTREGSIIFDALAPAALEMAIMYTEIANAINESFVDTASRTYILKGCEQMGIDTSIFDASAGIHKAEFNVPVEIGSRWNCDLYNYTVIKLLGQVGEYYNYEIQCETLGTEPNNTTGNLSAITDIPQGLTHSVITECIIEGENETSDEDIKQYYFDYINNISSDGNVNQYIKWCHNYDGIGNCKIFPLWNGANTVKVSILSSSNRQASNELISEFQEYLDPNTEGMGNGVAPIGAFVTVSTATELPINISATITMKSGYTDTSGIATHLSDYLSSLAYEKSMVAYMNIGASILNAEGVESISNLIVNEGTADIQLTAEQIPVIGTTTWTVSD